MSEIKAKKCTKCGNIKLYTEFYKREDSKDGYYQQCKSCIKKKTNEYNNSHEEERKILNREYKKKKRLKNPQEFDRLHNLHVWMRKNKKRPHYCTICNETKFLEIASIGHTYTKDPNDWLWLCFECHRLFDREKKTVSRNLVKEYENALTKISNMKKVIKYKNDYIVGLLESEPKENDDDDIVEILKNSEYGKYLAEEKEKEFDHWSYIKNKCEEETEKDDD